VRLSERFKTVGFAHHRCGMTVDEAVMIAGLTRALVPDLLRGVRDEPFQPRPELVRAAHWRAAR